MHISDVANNRLYHKWREQKLAKATSQKAPDLVSISAPEKLTREEYQQLKLQVFSHNFCLYQSDKKVWTKEDLVLFGSYFGLNTFDKHLYGVEGVSDIEVTADKKQGEFIPYTNRRLGWHTDGYYNPNLHWVTAIILHCNQPASQGGENSLVDPDLLYIYLRDKDPELIDVLMNKDCMAIPEYDDGVAYNRPASTGPVFWFNQAGYLQMRYTQRKKHVQWSDNQLLTKARQLIDDWLADSEQVIIHTLRSGQGILSNNVLHNRSAFENTNDEQRHLLRARYIDSI